MKKTSKLRLYDEVLKIANQKKIGLGFDSDKLPDKSWLTNILQALDKNNQLLTKVSDFDGVIGITRDDLK